MQAPLSRSISNGSDEYGRPKKNAGRVQPGASGTLEGSITALADALSSLEAGMPPDMARQLDFEPLDLVCLYLLKHHRPLPITPLSMFLAGRRHSDMALPTHPLYCSSDHTELSVPGSTLRH